MAVASGQSALMVHMLRWPAPAQGALLGQLMEDLIFADIRDVARGSHPGGCGANRQGPLHPQPHNSRLTALDVAGVQHARLAVYNMAGAVQFCARWDNRWR